MLFAPTLIKLLMGHALADYALQSDWMARNKNRHVTPNFSDGTIPPTIWPYVLSSHALIHGMVAWFVTGSIALGTLEALLHWAIDFGRCEKWFNIHTDQVLHILCKILLACLSTVK